ncbi:twin-arginine translocation signal domain-containing protein, partial [Halobacterium salinarum]|uniref:twin-arginine translocation signal domain-containing protein n=1 Tax=Halobacterium salinarum TaxID=2242 RepID=UPI00255416E7
MNRRNFVKSGVALAGSVAIAGCSDSTDSQSSGDNNEAANNTTEQEQPSGTRWYDSGTKIGVMEGVEAEVDSIGSL